MNAKEAVAKRILELCEIYKTNPHEIAHLSQISPSTIYSMLNEKSQNPGIVTLSHICNSLNISIKDFFDSPLFDELSD